LCETGHANPNLSYCVWSHLISGVINGKIKDLELLANEFDKAPIDEKITMFNTLYNKKNSQEGKWTVWQAQLLISHLTGIKTQLYALSRNSDYDNGDFETKRLEVQGLLDGIKSFNDNIYVFSCVPGNTPTEKIKKFLSEKDEEKPAITLEDVKTSWEGIQTKFNLTDDEKNALELIRKAIANPNQYKDQPTSDLDKDKLNAIFGTSLTDTEIQESSWKLEKGGYNQEKKIKDLVKTYNPNSPDKDPTKVGRFQEHLKHENWGTSGSWGGERIDGVDYWVKFVKKGPKFIIGAIKHFEWESKLGDYDNDDKKNAIITEMTNANDESKITVPDDKEIDQLTKWDTSKASHIAQFLYKKAIGLSGNDLAKNVTFKDKKQKEETPTGGKKWWEWGGYMAIWLSLTLVAIGGLVWAFWDNIKGWWEPKEGADNENE